VYNGEEFLKACIESVIGQTYTNFEYIILNNCSTDRSLEIALALSQRDPRIKVRCNRKFADIIENHNMGLRLMSSEAKYCKVVSADDVLFPDCIMRMVEVAEAHPSAGFVGCYQISGNHIRWQGFPYPKALLNGPDLCRQMFRNKDTSFGFGSPTSLLYRADIVRKTEAFYPTSSPHADTSVIYANLKDCDFGFVYQTLCWKRLHQGSQTAKSAKLNEVFSSTLSDVIKYGRYYLSEKEYDEILRQSLDSYYQFLALNIHREKEFWSYHKNRLAELGYPMSGPRLFKAGLVKVLKEIVNPEQAIRKIWQRMVSSARR
jgi:glycosyltransferase involved in cell wall biosynthesis